MRLAYNFQARLRAFCCLSLALILTACFLTVVHGPVLDCGERQYFLRLSSDKTYTVYFDNTLIARGLRPLNISELPDPLPPSAGRADVFLRFEENKLPIALLLDREFSSWIERNDGRFRGRFAARMVEGEGQTVEQCTISFMTN